MHGKPVKTIVPIVIILLLIPAPAYAYIDPGTGSSIFQALLAVIVAIPFLIKMYWKKIKLLFSRSQQPKKEGKQ